MSRTARRRRRTAPGAPPAGLGALAAALVAALLAAAGCGSRTAGAPAGGDAAAAASAAARPAAGAIPDHPAKLTYDPLRFELAPGEGFRHQLPSGLVVYVAEDHDLPLVTVSTLVRTGSYLDPADRQGAASLTGRMLRRGGTERRSAQEFDERADFLAAQIGASTGDTSGGASVDCLSQTLADCLDLFFEMLRQPAFEQGRLQVEKANLLESLKQRNDDPQDILGREWQWLLRGREHFTSAFRTAGELERIGRQDLVAFHRRWWHPGNMIFAVAGDVDTAAILAQLAERTAGWEAGERAPWPPPPPRFTPRPGVYHVEKDVPQGAVSIGHLSKQRQGWDDPDEFPLLVMNEILGGAGFTSRITKRVRSDEGLAYSAGSALGLGEFWPGTFEIYYQSKSPTVAYAARIALDEVRRIRAEPVTDEELKIAKSSLVDSFPRFFETPEQLINTYSRDAYLGRPHAYWQQYRDRVRAVTAADVQRVAQRYLDPEKAVFLVVGKWDEIVGGDPEGRAKMAEFFAGEVTHLPLRDPLTLEPVR
jgi:predicted Zn-dependent peptidase